MTDKHLDFCDDYECKNNFYNYINYNWIKNTVIPEDHKKWSTFTILQEHNSKIIKTMVEELDDIDPIKIIYQQFKNYEIKTNPMNFQYVKNIIKNIQSSDSTKDLFIKIMNYQMILNLSYPITFSIQSDLNDFSTNILHVSSGGLKLYNIVWVRF